MDSAFLEYSKEIITTILQHYHEQADICMSTRLLSCIVIFTSGDRLGVYNIKHALTKVLVSPVHWFYIVHPPCIIHYRLLLHIAACYFHSITVCNEFWRMLCSTHSLSWARDWSDPIDPMLERWIVTLVPGCNVVALLKHYNMLSIIFIPFMKMVWLSVEKYWRLLTRTLPTRLSIRIKITYILPRLRMMQWTVWVSSMPCILKLYFFVTVLIVDNPTPTDRYLVGYHQ